MLASRQRFSAKDELSQLLDTCLELPRPSSSEVFQQEAVGIK
jgi:hypothetical protein